MNVDVPVQRMKVLIWCPLVNPGGGVRLLLQLVHALACQPQIGLVRLAIPPGSVDRQSIEITHHPTLELYEIPTDQEVSKLQVWLQRDGRIMGVRGTGRLKRWLRERLLREAGDWQREQLAHAARGCDLVYVFWPHRQAFPEIALPVVCTFQDAIFFDFPEILGGPETRAEWQRARTWLHHSAQVVVSSQATKAALIRHFGEHCASAVVIPHAILPATLAGERDEDRSSSVRERLPSRYIVCPANIMSHKNHAVLLVAWSRFARRRQTPLVLFGSGTQILNLREPDWPDGWQPARLVGIVSRTGLIPGEDFYALGYVEDTDVLDLIRHAVALIMPTLAEGGGSFPVEEALSLGVPVLCSDIPVLREHLAGRSAKIGWFDPESPDSIVQALENLFDNYEDFKRSALKAANDPRPSWDEVAKQYVQVFQAVISGK